MSKSPDWSPEEINELETLLKAGLSHSEIAKKMNKSDGAISGKVQRLKAKDSPVETDAKVKIEKTIKNIDDDKERLRQRIEADLVESAVYQAKQRVYNKVDLALYREMYVDFCADPTIEYDSITFAQRDLIHTLSDLSLSKIRILEEIKEDKETIKRKKLDRPPINRTTELKNIDDQILKIHQSLHVERRQELDNKNQDIADFWSVIKSYKDPQERRKHGQDAGYFKYMGETSYNFWSDRGNIVSGKDFRYDLTKNFKGGKYPEGFTPNGDFFNQFKDKENKENIEENSKAIENSKVIDSETKVDETKEAKDEKVKD